MLVPRKQMPDFPAWTPQTWAALGAVVTAVVAMIAAPVAYLQVREARRSRKEQIQPFIVVDIQPSSVWGNLLNLVVENIGKTLARDVRIHFDPVISSSQYDLGQSTLVCEGIPSLPPNRRIEALFDVSHTRLNNGLPTRYDVVVEFSDARGRQQEPLRYVIDLKPLYGLQRVTQYGIHHAADALRDIEKTLRGWNRGGRLRVWSRDEDARMERNRIEQDLTGHPPVLGRRPPPEVLVRLARNPILRVIMKFVRELWGALRQRLLQSVKGPSTKA